MVALRIVISSGLSGGLGAALGVDPVADRKDGVEAVVDDPLGIPVPGSTCNFCTRCPGRQFTLLADVADVLGHDRSFASEQLGHLLLR